MLTASHYLCTSSPKFKMCDWYMHANNFQHLLISMAGSSKSVYVGQIHVKRIRPWLNWANQPLYWNLQMRCKDGHWPVACYFNSVMQFNKVLNNDSDYLRLGYIFQWRSPKKQIRKYFISFMFNYYFLRAKKTNQEKCYRLYF